MLDAIEALQKMDAFLAKHPNLDLGNSEFMGLKRKLAEQFGKVAQRAEHDFGGPWGFFTFALLGKAKTTSWFILNDHITKSLS